MITFPNAKINLGLNIVEKRSDGYHNIETIFYPVPIKDALEIIPAPKTTIQQTGIPLDLPAEKNIVVKAIRQLKKYSEIPPLEIHLLKNIPFGAGLGGGSADAAFMLKMLRDFFQLNLNDTLLENIASQIGADCPFFIRNTPVFASGIGNQFEKIEFSLKGYWLCLVKPDIFVSTPQAYAGATPKRPQVSLKEIIRQPIETWKETMVNDFETNVFPQFPAIGNIKQKLYEAGALYASMSGSGSSVFGIFQTPTCLKKSFPNCFVWEGAFE